MATQSLLSMTAYRKRKSRTRLLEALERFETDVLYPARMEPSPSVQEDMAEFLGQVLADHLIGNIQTSKDTHQLNRQYRHFLRQLRKKLEIKLKSLARFETMQ